MIGRLITWLRAQRIRHHNRRANAFGLAAVAAFTDRDFVRADAFIAQMKQAQAKRNALQEQARAAEMRRERWLHADGETVLPYQCTHDCDEGRSCPART